MSNELKIEALSIGEAAGALNNEEAYSMLMNVLLDYYSLANAAINHSTVEDPTKQYIVLSKDQMDSNYVTMDRVNLESDTTVTMVGLYKKDDPARINTIYWSLWYGDKIPNTALIKVMSCYEEHLVNEGVSTRNLLNNLGMHVIADTKDNILRAISL